MKSLFMAFLAATALFVAGCATADHNTSASPTSAVRSTSFSDEHYIWENWLFPASDVK